MSGAIPQKQIPAHRTGAIFQARDNFSSHSPETPPAEMPHADSRNAETGDERLLSSMAGEQLPPRCLRNHAEGQTLPLA
ncbi:MAG TPA: hypothetical protein VK090_00330 [Paracoccaceae bacterium]|nr:hypothetical protein [Paracoccaceae bacterium]